MAIKVENVSYTYGKKTPHQVLALNGVSLSIENHDFVALVGETGSGKSTLVECLNALLRPDNGQISVDDFIINNKKLKSKVVKGLRKHIGVVFQFPEYQLFEESVIKDVAFGIKNLGVKQEEALDKAKKALQIVGLDESYYERSPFELSGGEKRRVAIAGILVMEPEILVLDEPTVGLDPEGSQIIIDLMKKLYAQGKTIILVSHNMDLVLKVAKHAIVLHHGQVVFNGTPYELFDSITDQMAIEIPPLFLIAKRLKEKGFKVNLEQIKNASDLVRQIKQEIKDHD